MTLGRAGNGGASESALAQNAGVPALDGLGPVGGGFHSDAEFLELKTLTPRLYMLAELIMDLGRKPPAKGAPRAIELALVASLIAIAAFALRESRNKVDAMYNNMSNHLELTRSAIDCSGAGAIRAAAMNRTFAPSQLLLSRRGWDRLTRA